MSDTVPGTVPAPPSIVPPDPATQPLPGMPPAPPTPDAKPSSRPTTRAGRRAAAEARKASGQAPKSDKAPKSAKVPRRASLETRLTGSLTTLGTVVAASGSVTSPAVQADGIAIITHAPNIAAAMDKVAKDDPRVAASLERMLTAGVWSGLIAAMLPLVLTIAANHGAIPEGLAAMLNTVPVDQAEPEAPGTAPAAGSVPVV